MLLLQLVLLTNELITFVFIVISFHWFLLHDKKMNGEIGRILIQLNPPEVKINRILFTFVNVHLHKALCLTHFMRHKAARAAWSSLSQRIMADAGWICRQSPTCMKVKWNGNDSSLFNRFLILWENYSECCGRKNIFNEKKMCRSYWKHTFVLFTHVRVPNISFRFFLSRFSWTPLFPFLR